MTVANTVLLSPASSASLWQCTICRTNALERVFKEREREAQQVDACVVGERGNEGMGEEDKKSLRCTWLASSSATTFNANIATVNVPCAFFIADSGFWKYGMVEVKVDYLKIG